jgi:hypothetical protein
MTRRKPHARQQNIKNIMGPLSAPTPLLAADAPRKMKQSKGVQVAAIALAAQQLLAPCSRVVDVGCGLGFSFSFFSCFPISFLFLLLSGSHLSQQYFLLLSGSHLSQQYSLRCMSKCQILFILQRHKYSCSPHAHNHSEPDFCKTYVSRCQTNTCRIAPISHLTHALSSVLCVDALGLERDAELVRRAQEALYICVYVWEGGWLAGWLGGWVSGRRAGG